MKVLLIFVDLNTFHHNDYHFGLGYISAMLKSHGHEVRLMVIHSSAEFPNILKTIEDFKPGVVGMSSVETQFSYVKELSKVIRKVCHVPVVAGGVYTTLYPEAAKESNDLDGVFVGECEAAFSEFVRRVGLGEDFKSCPNFAYYVHKEDRLVVNQVLPLVRDLDRLPFPDREVFDYQEIVDRMGYAYFLFNRGCPYQCTYCSNHALARVYGGVKNNIRRRSVENCIDEIGEVLSRYNVNSKRIYIGDDLFTLDKNWLYSFLSHFKREFNKYEFFCCTRSNLVTDEMFKKLRDAGCFRVMMSIESGNDFIRNKVMKRNISRKRIVASFALAHKHGIETNGVSIIGLPFETKEAVEDTIRLVGECDVTEHGANVFYPYKGTELRKICEENNMIPSTAELTVSERKESILINNTINNNEITYFLENWGRLVNQHKPYYPKWRYPKFWIREFVRSLDLYQNYCRDSYVLRRIRDTPLIKRILSR